MPDRKKLFITGGGLVVAVVILIGVLARFTDILSVAESCQPMSAEMRAMHVEEIVLLNDRGKSVAFESHIADDNTERTAGYQHICSDTIDTSTILFVYSQSVVARFHMRNVWAPLDIGFFDDAGKLFSVMLMQPYGDGDAKYYDPGRPFQYALEARQGFFAEHDLSAAASRLLPGRLYDSR